MMSYDHHCYIGHFISCFSFLLHLFFHPFFFPSIIAPCTWKPKKTNHNIHLHPLRFYGNAAVRRGDEGRCILLQPSSSMKSRTKRDRMRKTERKSRSRAERKQERKKGRRKDRVVEDERERERGR